MSLAKEAPNYDIDTKRDLQRVQQEKGVTLFKQVGDFLHARKVKTGLTMEEYLAFNLYEKDRSEFAGYMGDLRAKSAFLMANNLSSWDAASDKHFYSALLSAANLPAPKIVAFVHKSRDAGGAQALQDVESIRRFLENCELPLFGKPVDASHGDGSINIVGRNGREFVVNSGEVLEFEALADQLATHLDNSKGYLLQSTLLPHSQIAKITGNRLATARLLIFVGPDGPMLRNCVLRLPAGENIVDNFRRPGNLVAGINPETGELGEAIRGVGLDQEKLVTHPDTNEPISGELVPDFEAAKLMAFKASTIYPDLRIQSWDVALTPEGPVLLEINPGGNFNIFQFVNGRGLFDEEFRKFVEWCMNENQSSASNPKAFSEAKKVLNLA